MRELIKQWGQTERSIHAAVRHARVNHPGTQQELDTLALEAQFKAAKGHGFKDSESQFSMERQIKGRIFSQEAKKALQEEGYIIYFPWGDSIQYLMDKQWLPLKTQTSWFIGEDFEYVPSLRCEIALHPQKLILPGSTNKTLKEQVAMNEEHSEEIGRKIKGTESIIGEATDYANIIRWHFEYFNKHKHLYGKENDNVMTRTLTRIYDSYYVYLGDHVIREGIRMSYNFPDWTHEKLGVTSLIIPSKSA